MCSNIPDSGPLGCRVLDDALGGCMLTMYLKLSRRFFSRPLIKLLRAARSDLRLIANGSKSDRMIGSLRRQSPCWRADRPTSCPTFRLSA